MEEKLRELREFLESLRDANAVNAQLYGKLNDVELKSFCDGRSGAYKIAADMLGKVLSEFNAEN